MCGELLTPGWPITADTPAYGTYRDVMTSEQRQTETVIVGGGVAALEAALALRERGAGRVHTTLVAPNADFTYRPARVGEPFGHAAARRYSLKRIARELGIQLHADTVTWVDTDERAVHTKGGLTLSYDALLLAVGARLHTPFAHALTLDPNRLDEQLQGVIQDVEGGWLHSVAYVIPSLYTWPLPIYELALMTAARAYEMSSDLTVTLVTPEDAPLAIFGETVSAQTSRLLSERGITTVTGSHCAVHAPGHLTIDPGAHELVADQIIALPELHGPEIQGIPRSATFGFITTDRHGLVSGLERVFAAGDATDFPIKHGGIASQQADAAADSIAALAGANVVPEPVIPMVHGLLWGAEQPLYLQAQVAGGQGTTSVLSAEPLWTPATKIHARYLGPYLESLDRADVTAVTP